MIALTPPDAGYPRGLCDLPRPPATLWVDGDVSSLHETAIAIVGTRRMTGYGERVARELALACANAGIVVVSGLAQGIDSAAHRGALDGEGKTVAVLGESIPFFLATVRGRRRPLVPRIRASGALVSELLCPALNGEGVWHFVAIRTEVTETGVRRSCRWIALSVADSPRSAGQSGDMWRSATVASSREPGRDRGVLRADAGVDEERHPTGDPAGTRHSQPA